VMVPRPDVVWTERDTPLDKVLRLALKSGYSRIPVLGESIDDIIGVAYLKDIVRAQADVTDGSEAPLTAVMRPPAFVPDSKRVDELLKEMQAARNHMAIVVDEYGGTAGVVTIEDILEEIVGEITDEYDVATPDPVEHLADGSVRVSAKLPVEDLGDVFDVVLPAEDVETVGGMLAQVLGRVALPGAEAVVNGLLLTGEAGVDRRGRPRVQTLLVRRLTEDESVRRSTDAAENGPEDEPQLEFAEPNHPDDALQAVPDRDSGSDRDTRRQGIDR